MDFRVFSRNISENMHARCVREDTKQALKENLQADGVQSRQTLFVRYCLKYSRQLHASVSLLLRKHCIKLVRKMRRQIFRQIAQKFRRHTVCMARDFWVI